MKNIDPKNINLENLSRKMPYEAPSSEFFEIFTSQLLEQATAPKKTPKILSLSRLITPLMGVAAAAAVILTVTFSLNDHAPQQRNYLICDNLEDSVNSFFDSLSDEDLASLASDTAYNDDFYLNLPNN